MQNRVGPNKAGPLGLLQTLADGMKLIFKEDFSPSGRPLRLPPAPFLAVRAGLPRLVGDSAGGDFSDGKDGTVEWPASLPGAAGRPAMGFLIVLALSSIRRGQVMLAG